MNKSSFVNALRDSWRIQFSRTISVIVGDIVDGGGEVCLLACLLAFSGLLETWL